MPPTDVQLRRGDVGDAEVVTAVHLASRRTAPMPASIHAADDVGRWLAGRLAQDEVWVAELDGAVVGYVRLTDTWLDDLYVLPAHARQGIGSMLLDLAKALRPDGFSLWVFQTNTPARAFYAHRGLVEREHTDGSDNEEKSPDLRMSWQQD